MSSALRKSWRWARSGLSCLAPAAYWMTRKCRGRSSFLSRRKIPFIQFLYGADNVGTDTWEIRDLLQYGLDGADKYMALAFECGLALM